MNLELGTLNSIRGEGLIVNGTKVDGKSLRNKLESFFKDNAQNFGIDIAFLYGSWAVGSPRDDSDVDVAVWRSSALSSSDEAFAKITYLSTRLSLLLNKEVNILILSPYFREPMIEYNAIVLGTPVFIGSFDLYVKIRMEAITQMEDFSIFGRRWQLEVAEKRLRERIHA
ncbi:MAG: nucleotidyltransferase domain-containing protein [Desulfobacteraceae bacterium]|nr:MAG: nucleotidyltransferase domain-containing protein [Desulfobacteraceae bacterium]